MTPGDPVRLEMTKWRDQPHWQMGAVFLGRDDAGTWLGFPTGTHMARPRRRRRTTRRTARRNSASQ